MAVSCQAWGKVFDLRAETGRAKLWLEMIGSRLGEKSCSSRRKQRLLRLGRICPPRGGHRRHKAVSHRLSTRLLLVREQFVAILSGASRNPRSELLKSGTPPVGSHSLPALRMGGAAAADGAHPQAFTQPGCCSFFTLFAMEKKTKTSS